MSRPPDFLPALPRLERAALPHCRPRRRRNLPRLHRAQLAGGAARFACAANHPGRPTRIPRDPRRANGRGEGFFRDLEIKAAIPTYLAGSKALPWAIFHPRDFPSAPQRARASARVTWCTTCDIAAGGFSSTPRKGASAPASPWLRKRTPPTSRCGCASAAGSPTGCGSKPSSTPGSRPSSTGRAALRDPTAGFGEETRASRQRDARGRCAALTEAE